ncbi:hypothetical protein JTB14_032251 [Gonioctena quinquepunctata]|nr:hypothetical protein JTB14_032251 [Gonioctena quinquepunctata]
MVGRLFPDEYYSITASHSSQKRSNWFCNKPMSPVPELIQSTNVSSSDESLSQLKTVNNSPGIDLGVREVSTVRVNNLEFGDSNSNSLVEIMYTYLEIPQQYNLSVVIK